MVKRKMIIPQKSFESNEKFQIFIEQEKAWMYDRIYVAIRESFKSGIPLANIMEAKIEDTMSLITIDSEKDEWADSLNLALKWYISVEDYETCAEIRDLIESIENAELKD